MFRRCIAVAVGYVLWTLLWLGCGALLRTMAILPADETAAITAAAPLLALLGGSIIASLIAGYSVGLIHRTLSPAPVIALGMLLLATGVFVELQYWHLMPLWYHVLFLGLLLPVCVVGYRLQRRQVI